MAERLRRSHPPTRTRGRTAADRTMQVIPVLDVWRGRAVHATGGDRRRYGPVASVLASGSDPVSLARAFKNRLGVRTCYLADLTAIAGRRPSLPLIHSLADEGLRLWVDAAISDAAVAEQVLAEGAGRAVVGLETLPDLDALISVARAVSPDRLAFSLDLLNGRPLSSAPALAGRPALELAEQAFEVGYRVLIVLELGRVGALCGPSSDLVASLRARCPELSLVIGGGVRDRDDLRELAGLGCAGALVASALHVGRITRADIEAVAAL